MKGLDMILEKLFFHPVSGPFSIIILAFARSWLGIFGSPSLEAQITDQALVMILSSMIVSYFLTGKKSQTK